MTVKKYPTVQRRVLLILTFVMISVLCIGMAAAEDRVGSAKTKADSSLMKMSLANGASSCTLITTVYNNNANALATNLVGSGVTISNPTYTGTSNAAGTFANAEEGIGIGSGVILSSGDISYVVAPNKYDDVSYNNNRGGDVDLGSLIPGYITYDAAALEFDFVPVSDVVTFDYVFASDEYNEYANTNFNDVFGFFVNGKNIALVPGTSAPVSINNVNGGRPLGTNAKNPAYYINNDLSDGGGAICTEMDGLTKVFSATAKVNKGQVNHIKLAIADAGDHILDSNVFIKAGTFTSPQLTLTPLSESSTNCKLSHTVTATLIDSAGDPMPGASIVFTVTNGPNAGKTGTATTDANGVATWTYSSNGVSGTDTIVAKKPGASVEIKDLISNNAYMAWDCGTNAPEFPTLAVPVAMILGLVFVVYTVMMRKEE